MTAGKSPRCFYCSPSAETVGMICGACMPTVLGPPLALDEDDRPIYPWHDYFDDDE